MSVPLSKSPKEIIVSQEEGKICQERGKCLINEVKSTPGQVEIFIKIFIKNF